MAYWRAVLLDKYGEELSRLNAVSFGLTGVGVSENFRDPFNSEFFGIFLLSENGPRLELSKVQEVLALDFDH